MFINSTGQACRSEQICSISKLKFLYYVCFLHVTTPNSSTVMFSSKMVTPVIFAPFPRCELIEQAMFLVFVAKGITYTPLNGGGLVNFFSE